LGLRFLSELFRFLIFGLLAVSIDYGVFIALVAMDADPVIAKAIGYFAALAFAMMFVVRFTFHRTVQSTENLKVLAIYIATGIANVAVFQIMRTKDLSSTLSFLVAVTVSSILNFFILRFIVQRGLSRS
jgi:putative flippase GtrA